MNKLILFSIIILLASCKRKVDYAAFKNCQDYTVPLWKDDQINKSALFVFPHPDDEIVCGGTIDQLKKSGWRISILTLTRGAKEEKETRLREWNNSCDILAFDNREIHDLVNNTWDDVLKNKIEFWYNHQDSIENIISRSINKYQPSIIFTYDTAFGGYGHPEHRVSALAVYKVFEKHKTDSLFPVRKILQITLPDKYIQLKFASSEAFSNAKKYTGNISLPNPTVAFDITNNWRAKKNAGLAYISQTETLRKFYLLPELEDSSIHYTTFDREYYFEITY